jgi:cytidylate kinase
VIVTIDGPAGTGKSTIAALAAERSGLHYLNSGSVYRAITYGLLEIYGEELGALIDLKQEDLIGHASKFDLQLRGDGVILNGHSLGNDELRSDRVDSFVAPISSIPELREQVNRLLIEISRNEDIIVEGRDMSTVVFPHADVKFFLDASVEARARRRSGQGTSELTYEQILSSIRTRDAIDKNKAVGALKVADEAIYLDTSDLTIDQVCEIVVGSLQEHK